MIRKHRKREKCDKKDFKVELVKQKQQIICEWIKSDLLIIEI